MVSHGNCFEICAEKRNFKINQTRQLGKNQGVQGIFFSAKYVGAGNNLNMDNIMDHFVRTYSIAPEAIMIGSDFGGISSGFVNGLENIDCLDELWEKLRMRLGESATKKIAYKNYLNFLKKIL